MAQMCIFQRQPWLFHVSCIGYDILAITNNATPMEKMGRFLQFATSNGEFFLSAYIIIKFAGDVHAHMKSRVHPMIFPARKHPYTGGKTATRAKAIHTCCASVLVSQMHEISAVYSCTFNTVKKLLSVSIPCDSKLLKMQ